MLDTSWRWLLADKLASGDPVTTLLLSRWNHDPESLHNIPTSKGPLSEIHRNDLRKVPRFEISNVASYFNEYGNGFDELPNLTIPFRHFWMEFKIPTHLAPGPGDCAGAECLFDGRELKIYGYLGGPNFIWTTECTPIIPLDREGKIIRDEVRGYLKDRKFHIDVSVTLFALALMGCKNVSREDVAPSRQVRRAMERDGVAHCTYKVLLIQQRKNHSNSAGNSNGNPKSLHICRGHFKTFTQERPLFGSVTGTYWWEEHIRGDYENGVVVKDYALASRPVN